MHKTKLRQNVGPFDAPFINIEATVIQPGVTNGVPNVKKEHNRQVAPTAKKIATYITNQIFGSDILLELEGVEVNWVMPTLRETLEEAIYSIEGFIYIHFWNGKIYLENIKKNELHNLVQKWDKVVSGTIIQDTEINNNIYSLKRHFNIENGITYLNLEACVFEKGKEKPIHIEQYNAITGNDYETKYILPYEVLINIDIGQDFFSNSRRLLVESMNVINTLAAEIKKTETKIVTSQHFQSSDLIANWVPGNAHYKVESLTVNNIKDYFTLLPGDKNHTVFEFLQGNLRIQEYKDAFKFYDYQIIQQAGLSTASFGYEKDAYMNQANVQLSANNSEMTIEAIKTQIEGQINNLFENIIKAQSALNVKINQLQPSAWDYGSNERFDDLKKISMLNRLQSVISIPYETRLQILLPMLKKLIGDGEVDDEQLKNLVEKYENENNKIAIEYGEI